MCLVAWKTAYMDHGEEYEIY